MQKTLHFMFVFKYQKGTLLQKCCFLFIIPFLYLEIKIMYVKNFRRKSDISSLSPTSPRVYALQKMLAYVYRYLWVFIQFYGIWNLSALWYQKIIFWINEVACLFACFMNILVKYVLYNSPPPRLFTLNYNERSTNLWFIYTSNLSSLKSHI